MTTLIQEQHRGKHDRNQRWARIERADLLARYSELHTQGVSQRQAAKTLNVPRSTRQAWRAYQENLDECPTVVAFFQSVPGLAFLHRFVIARHVVCVEMGACGMRLVCLLLKLTGLARFVGASYGTQQQGNRHVAEAMVAYGQEESPRLAREMPPKEMTMPLDETFTGGLCLVGMEPESHDIVLEQTAPARDQDTWNTLMAPALAGLNCTVIQATSAEAPDLRAYVAPHLGAPHAPDLFHVPQELSKAVAAPMATKQRAAAKARTKAEETLKRVHAHLHNATEEPQQRGPGRRPKVAASLEPVAQDVDTARQEHHRLVAQRVQVTRSIRAIGHAYHFVDLERGVRRNGKRLAGDIPPHLDMIRTIAQHERLSESGMERIEKAKRVVPKMQATMAFVAGYVRKQVRQLGLAQPASYAMHAHLIPSYYLARVAATRTVTAGEPLRALAERLRQPLFEPHGAVGAFSTMEQNTRKAHAAKRAEVFQRSSSNVEGRNGYLSRRNHQLRGRAHPRKRACLTAIHNFFLTRADGTTAAERFFGQKPRSMFAGLLAAVEIPPAPLSPPERRVE